MVTTDQSIIDQIITSYKRGHSLRRIATDTGLGWQKCRKILIDAGVYSSPTADKIRDLAAEGLTQSEIAKRLKMELSTVTSYYPYAKSIYNQETPTVNAQRIRKCRERRRG